MSCDPCTTRNVAVPTGGSQCQPGPRGARGPSGSGGAAGSNGLHAYTLTTANFTMPAIGANVSVQVGNGAWIATGQIIFVEGAGFMSASAPTSTTVTLTNLGYPANANAGTSVESGAIVSPGAPKGGDAPVDSRGYILLRRELGTGNNAGTFTSGSWVARVLNTTVNDTQEQVIEFNPLTGIFKVRMAKFKVYAEAPAFDVGRHRSRLRNITAGGALYGTSEFTGDNGQTVSVIKGRFDLDEDTEFILESRCQTTKANTGLGFPTGFDSNAEVFEFVEFEEVP